MARPNSTPPTPLPHAHRGREELAEVIESAEEIVERAVIAAERSLLRRIGLRGFRLLRATGRVAWRLAVVAFFLFALTLILARYYLLPHIDDWRPRIEAAAVAQLHVPVSIGAIEGDWEGLRPRLLLHDVSILDAQGQPALALEEVEAVLSWTSLIAWQPRMHSIGIAAPQLLVRRLPDRRFAVAGFLIDPQARQPDSAMLDWLLAQERISIHDASVHFIDEAAPASATPAAEALPVPPVPTAAPEYDFTHVDFLLTKGLTGHRFSLQLQPPKQLAGPLDLRGEFSHAWGEPTARMASWSGNVYVQFDNADLARLESLVHLIPAPARLDRAQGAMRAWIDFAALQITRLRADVALTGVDAQWRPDLDPMRLDHVQGRITQAIRSDRGGETQELTLSGLSMDGPDGLHLPPTDLVLRTTRLQAAAGTVTPPPSGSARIPAATEQSRLEANRIVLADWSRLARQFPLPTDWLSLIERTAARGTLEDLQVSWDGPRTPPRAFALHTRFSGLGFTVAADSAAPVPADAATAGPAPPAQGHTDVAVENFAGTIDLTQDSGSLRLDGSDMRFRLAPVFGENTLWFNTLVTQARWSRDGRGRLDVDVDALTAINDDLEVRASGNYRAAGSGAAEPARLDLSGRVSRAQVSATSRYLPVSLPPSTKAWLQGALLDGTGTDGSFLVRGDPAQFPFVEPHAGEFHANLQVHGARLDFAPPIPPEGPVPADAPKPLRWPELSAIEANVVFDRDHLTVNGRRARAMGYELANVIVQIPHMTVPGQHLSVDGQGSGSLAELLRYVSASPVNFWTGGWLGDVKANGPAHLTLKLDVPLAHSNDTTVAGTLGLQGDGITLRPDLVPFTQTNGNLDFTQRGIRFNGISAGFAGGDVRLNADTKADGAILIQGVGTATPQGARPMTQPAAVQRMLDLTRGQVHYTAQVAIVHDTVALQVDSDLVGLAANLPPPFRKSASEARPLHVEIAPAAGAHPARDTLRVTMADALDAELQQVSADDGHPRIERGFIGVGAKPRMPDSGLLLFVDQPALDADRWHTLLNPPPASGSGAEGGAARAGDEGTDFDLVVMHTPSLTLAGKTATNVSLSAHRDSSHAWLIDIDSDQAAGSVRWSEATANADGRLMARLAKLTIPERDKKQVSELLATPPTDYPELDIVAEQFELGQHSLGRLELAAQSSGDAGSRVWNLNKLVISSPDGKVTGSGVWQRESGANVRRMNLKLAMTGSNVGGMLDRFGLGGYVKDGNGKLDGELAWNGAPFSIDYPSLSGRMHFTAEKGQVLKLEAGAARLLAIFSLQSVLSLVSGDLREFSAGVGFDSMSATATIANGVMSTDDFNIKGNSGDGRIKGSLDLNAETMNLEVAITPVVNASLASLGYAALVNPAIGLSTFVGTYVLKKPLSELFARTYSVTGPWKNPEIKSVKADKAQGPSAPGAVGAAANAGSTSKP